MKHWLNNQSEYDDHNGKYEHNKRNSVHAMHVLHPLCSWLIRISFFNVEVLAYLFPDTHIVNFN